MSRPAAVLRRLPDAERAATLRGHVGQVVEVDVESHGVRETWRGTLVSVPVLQAGSYPSLAVLRLEGRRDIALSSATIRAVRS